MWLVWPCEHILALLQLLRPYQIIITPLKLDADTKENENIDTVENDYVEEVDADDIFQTTKSNNEYKLYSFTTPFYNIVKI